jgi:glycosyltransferase involved in cell wall biosynthesis
LTQLLLRVALPTPSGIGRVELAYANYLLTNYPDRVRFIFALPRRPRLIPVRKAARYLRAIQQIWGSTDNISDQLELKLNRYLDGVVFAEEPTQAVLTTRQGRQALLQTNVARRILIAAEFLLNLLTYRIRPFNLKQFSHAEVQSAYVSVSNSIITSQWLTRWLGRSPSVSGIFLLHDLIPITNPEFTLPKTTVQHLKYLRRLSKTADTIIANSRYTATCLERYAASVKLSLPNVVVSPLGVDSIFLKERAASLQTTPYFVFTATIEPRKNHIMLLQVWQRMVAKYGDKSPKLLLIGRRGWENENTLDLIERAECLRDYVIECGNVPDQLLIKLLAHARAALFPSHIEGFGLPLAEALSMGVPIICSDIDPFKEIAGDIPEYVDPLAGRGWLKLIMEYASDDSERRAAQIERMANFKPFGWDDHMAALDQVLVKTTGITKSQPAAVLRPSRVQKAGKGRGIGEPGVVTRALAIIGRTARRFTRTASTSVQMYREHALNNALASRLGGRRPHVQPDLVEGRAQMRPDVIASFRGLRCAIVGKIADRTKAADIVMDAARERIDMGIAQIAIAIVYPKSLRNLEFHRLDEELTTAALSFAVLTEDGRGSWRTGGVDDILSALRKAHDHPAGEEALQHAVAALNASLAAISNSLIDDQGACDELGRVLGIRSESNATAFV